MNEQSIKMKRAETEKKGDDLVEWKERRGTTPPGMDGWMDGGMDGWSGMWSLKTFQETFTRGRSE